jgi:hypothetical protein
MLAVSHGGAKLIECAVPAMAFPGPRSDQIAAVSMTVTAVQRPTKHAVADTVVRADQINVLLSRACRQASVQSAPRVSLRQPEPLPQLRPQCRRTSHPVATHHPTPRRPRVKPPEFGGFVASVFWDPGFDQIDNVSPAPPDPAVGGAATPTSAGTRAGVASVFDPQSKGKPHEQTCSSRCLAGRRIVAPTKLIASSPRIRFQVALT